MLATALTFVVAFFIRYSSNPGIQFVQQVGQAIQLSGLEFRRISFRPVQQGLTQPYPFRRVSMEPHMCVPIYPETKHPLYRKPIRTFNPFPWAGCYHPTTHCFDFRVPSELRDYGTAIKAASPGIVALYRVTLDDRERLIEMAKAKIAGLPPPPLELAEPPSDSMDFDSDPVEEPRRVYVEHECSARPSPNLVESETLIVDGTEEPGYWDGSSICDTASYNLTDNDSDADSVFSDDEHSIPEAPTPAELLAKDVRFTPIIKFSIDLSTVGAEIPDFRDIYTESRALERCTVYIVISPVPLFTGVSLSIVEGLRARLRDREQASAAESKAIGADSHLPPELQSDHKCALLPIIIWCLLTIFDIYSRSSQISLLTR